ncbi:MAG: B12-binding domain-containing radical SAM protein [Desulfobacteraceae bacterium]|nr:B12-binding domain-containing radical SAM protein [Desulfobacteraceae bacterium]
MNSYQLTDKIVLVVPISHTHYVVPPIGLGYLATALRRINIDDIEILDCVKEKLSFENLGKRFNLWKPKVVGFQVFSYDFDSVIKSIDIVKQVSPETVVLVGGPHVSATAATALEEIKGADFGFAGEGEIALPMLLRRILKNEQIPFQDIPGLIWRENSTIHNNPRTVIDDLDSLGFPAWDIMSPASYPDNPQGGFYKNFPIAPIATTRGCPYPCTFCGSGVNMGSKLRLRNINHVLDEMELLYNDFGVREFHIIDDMFNFYKNRVIEFCQGITARGLRISYTFPNGLRLNQLDREMLQIMKDTGAYAFTVGIESGSQRILDSMKKKLTLELIMEKVDLICSVGLEPSGFFIIGYPDESVEDIEATIRFAKKLKIKRAHFSNFLPLPGTEATQKLIENKEIERPDWNTLFYSKVAYTPEGITKKQLKELQRRAFLEFHLRPHILLKMLSEIKSFNHLKQIFIRIIDYLF